MRLPIVRRTCRAATLSLAFLLAVAPARAKTVVEVPPAHARLDLNTASLAALEKLPGVDQATAKQIIVHRPYTSVADLSKAGLPASTVETYDPHLRVGPLGTAAAATGKGVDKAATGVEKGADAAAERGREGRERGREGCPEGRGGDRVGRKHGRPEVDGRGLGATQTGNGLGGTPTRASTTSLGTRCTARRRRASG